MRRQQSQALRLRQSQAVGYLPPSARRFSFFSSPDCFGRFKSTRIATIVEQADRATRQYLQSDATPSIEDVDRAIELQNAAVSAEPDNGEALIRSAELKSKRYELETGRSTLQLYSDVALAERIGNVAEIQRLRQDSAVQRLLRPALEECRRARDACPFNYFVHLLMAQLCFLDDAAGGERLNIYNVPSDWRKVEATGFICSEPCT